MKRLILIILVSLPIFGVSQSIVDTLCFELPYRKLAPAPCSIEDTSTTETKLFIIKVGLYDRDVTAREYIIKLDLGSQYHYFYNQLFRNRDNANNALKNLKEIGYCDAYVVELPSFITSFEFEAPKTETILSKPTQTQSGVKVMWNVGEHN